MVKISGIFEAELAASNASLHPSIVEGYSYYTDFGVVKDKELNYAVTSGLYRQNKGGAFWHTYDFEDFKLVLAGEFDFKDGFGNAYHATAGDLMYFPKGSRIHFDTQSTGLAYFTGQRDSETLS